VFETVALLFNGLADLASMGQSFSKVLATTRAWSADTAACCRMRASCNRPSSGASRGCRDAGNQATATG
jgi:hypothetical protein